jgi:hypothetical protein
LCIVLGASRGLFQSGDKSEGGYFEHDARTGKLIAHRGIAPTLEGTDSKRQQLYPHTKDCCNISRFGLLVLPKTVKPLKKIRRVWKHPPAQIGFNQVPSPARSAARNPAQPQSRGECLFFPLNTAPPRHDHHPPPPRPSLPTVSINHASLPSHLTSRRGISRPRSSLTRQYHPVPHKHDVYNDRGDERARCVGCYQAD